MSAELITPVDELTGIPLPIAPKCDWLPLDRPEIADVHHSYHPKQHPLLKTVAGLALRNSRLQILERELHNAGPLRYHQYFEGPELARDDADVFSRCVLACAGYIPDEVIDLSSGEPVRRPIRTQEAEFLRMPTDNPEDPFSYRHILYRYGPIRDFFHDYAVRQNINHLSNRHIDEFLHTQDLEKKTKLGKFFLQSAVAVASETIREKYSMTRRMRLLHPGMPDGPQRLVWYKLGTPDLRAALIPRLETHLLAKAA
ncbi:MAG: hypothetical protein JWL85_756 [Candidatus Saccharibacteria bacterium]|nr:hypothetical protein [Candidatus Saccharibacteria bacterium]